MGTSLSHLNHGKFLSSFLCAIFISSFAWADAHAGTERILFRGELIDSQGGAISGMHMMRFKIFENTKRVWQKVYSEVDVDNGKFSLVLEDEMNPLKVDCGKSPQIAVEVHNSIDFERFLPLGSIEKVEANTKPMLQMKSESMNIKNVLVEPISEGCGSRGPRGYQGPAGPRGPTGPAGSTGPQGPVGETGAIGPQGPVGATGAIGPQGIPGAPGASGGSGPQGLQGPAGPAGATGSTGLSGYETETETGSFQTAKRKTETVECGTGKNVISGGVHVSHTTVNTSNLNLVAEKVHISSSYPSSATEWTVTLYSQDQTSSYIYTAYAVCATITP
jgi:hypothetical protein